MIILLRLYWKHFCFHCFWFYIFMCWFTFLNCGKESFFKIEILWINLILLLVVQIHSSWFSFVTDIVNLRNVYFKRNLFFLILCITLQIFYWFYFKSEIYFIPFFLSFFWGPYFRRRDLGMAFMLYKIKLIIDLKK